MSLILQDNVFLNGALGTPMKRTISRTTWALVENDPELMRRVLSITLLDHDPINPDRPYTVTQHDQQGVVTITQD